MPKKFTYKFTHLGTKPICLNISPLSGVGDTTIISHFVSGRSPEIPSKNADSCSANCKDNPVWNILARHSPNVNVFVILLILKVYETLKREFLVLETNR